MSQIMKSNVQRFPFRFIMAGPIKYFIYFLFDCYFSNNDDIRLLVKTRKTIYLRNWCTNDMYVDYDILTWCKIRRYLSVTCLNSLLRHDVDSTSCCTL